MTYQMLLFHLIYYLKPFDAVSKNRFNCNINTFKILNTHYNITNTLFILLRILIVKGWFVTLSSKQLSKQYIGHLTFNYGNVIDEDRVDWGVNHQTFV